eukprot:1155635-Pelagomonas_calceolata.AAC.3
MENEETVPDTHTHARTHAHAHTQHTPVARRPDCAAAVEKVDMEEIIFCMRAMSRRVPLPYRSLRRAAFIRGLLSVSRRRER